MAGSVLIYALFSLLVPLPTVESTKIIFYTGRGEGSHYTSAAYLAEELVSRGHEVTFLLGSAFDFRASHPVQSNLFHFKFIMTDTAENDEYVSVTSLLTKSGFEERNGAFVSELLTLWARNEVKYCRRVFAKDMLRALEAEDFDMMVLEPVIWPCSLLLSQHLNVKTVVLLQTSMNAALLRSMGHPINPATIPEMGLDFPTKMNFWQRVLNCLMAFTYQYILPDHFVQHYFDEFGMRSWIVALSEVDLVVSFSDPLVDDVVPLFPGHIMAAGLTTRPAGPLDQDYEGFMQSSGEHGVILFTIGSYVTELPERVLKAYRDAFAELPQKVIWQLKNGTLSDVPENVRTREWIPQNDLLGHTKTRLLIYQGGNNGLYEAVYHGVPLIAMPIFSDHVNIAQNVVEKGIGLRIRPSELTSVFIRQQIVEVLTNVKYKRNMERISTMFRDRPQNPQERAAHWVEHVLKYGSEHLQRPGSDMSFIQYYLFDVVGFLILCVALTILLVYAMLKYTVKLISYACAARKTKGD